MGDRHGRAQRYLSGLPGIPETVIIGIIDQFDAPCRRSVDVQRDRERSFGITPVRDAMRDIDRIICRDRESIRILRINGHTVYMSDRHICADVRILYREILDIIDIRHASADDRPIERCRTQRDPF